MYPVALAALAITIVAPVAAGITGSQHQAEERDTSANPQHGILNKIIKLLHRGASEQVNELVARQQGVCVYDDVYSVVSSFPSATAFCSQFISVPLATVTVDYTPTS